MESNQEGLYKGSFNVDQENIRADIFLQNKFNFISRTKIKEYINKNHFLIDSSPIKPSYILKIDEVIDYNFSTFNKENIIIPEEISLDIIFEDDYLIAINKPAGLVVHPGSGISNGTLVNGLAHHFSKLSTINNQRPGIVHRLDKETSGIILIAKDDETHAKLSKQFENRKVKKIYRAIVWGKTDNSGSIKGYINRDRKHRTKFVLNLNEKGKMSETSYKKIEDYPPLSYIELYPKTGRTHQIRVHMKSISHPIMCDSTYGGGKTKIKSFHMKYNSLLKLIIKTLNRVALHAYSIEIEHPKTLKKMKFTAPIPKDFVYIIKILEES